MRSQQRKLTVNDHILNRMYFLSGALQTAHPNDEMFITLSNGTYFRCLFVEFNKESLGLIVAVEIKGQAGQGFKRGLQYLHVFDVLNIVFVKENVPDLMSVGTPKVRKPN